MLREIKSTDIFTHDALNIFTDASMRKIKKQNGEVEQIGCAGAILVFGAEEESESHYQIIRNTTNNNSEIKAIRLGVQNALKYKDQFKYIRLFSDSQISIFGIRERIFKWYIKHGQFCGYDGTPIKNQDIMLEIVNTLILNNMRIELYHQAGHVETNQKSLLEAIHVFAASNNIRDTISYEFMKKISGYNNAVDSNSRLRLDDAEQKIKQNNSAFSDPLKFRYTDFDKARYSNLVNTI